MGWLIRDLRWASMIARRNLGLTVAVVLSMGLAIGANSAVFSVVDAFLLRPLPLRDMDRLVRLRENAAEPGKEPSTRSLSTAVFFQWQEYNQVFEGIAAADGVHLNLTGSGDAERLQGAAITANFLPLMGVQPVLGRNFLPEEDRPGQRHVALLGHNLWTSRFNADRGVLGRTIILNGQPHEIIGVLPPNYSFPHQADIMVPLALRNDPSEDARYELMAVARLKPGISIARANTEMAALCGRLAREHPLHQAPASADFTPLRKELLENLDQLLFLLSAIALFVLLIACVNCSNLLLSQSLSQSTEVAVRLSLGARRGHVIRQYLVYSLLLAILGGVLAVLVTFWSVRPLIALSSVNASIRDFDVEPRIDARALAFTLGLSALAGMLLGLVPAIRVSRTSLRSSLQEGGRASSLGAAGRRLLNGFVVSEVALALILLVGAGLILGSFERLIHSDRGFSLDNLMTFETPFPEARFPQQRDKVEFVRRAVERIRTLPGVISAGATTTQPLFPGTWSAAFNPEGRPAANATGYYVVHTRTVTPGYLESMKIRLLQGRLITEQDTATSPDVVVISKTMADHYWPGENPLGKRVKRGVYSSTRPWMTIVGVVDSLKETSDEDVNTNDAWYLPYTQASIPDIDTITFVVHYSADVAGLVPALRGAIRAIDKDQPIYHVATMQELLHERTLRQRFGSLLCGILGFLGLVLAALGIYSVLSFSVHQRHQEIGVRVALGARPADIKKLVVGGALVLTTTGMVLGLLVSLALTRLISSLLFEISARDPVILTGALLLLLVVTLIASYLPALRAARTDPMTAIRYQ
jgi:putative ABC transport system permease protein